MMGEAWRPAVSGGNIDGSSGSIQLPCPPPLCFFQGALSGGVVSAEMGSKTGAGASAAEGRKGEEESPGCSAK